jgi:hypothetical protein
VIHSFAATVRKVPIWVYVGLALVGIVVTGDSIAQRKSAAAAANDFAALTNESLRLPITGITFKATTYRWAPPKQPPKQPLEPNAPLTTNDSYSFELTPQGSDCRSGPTRSIAIALSSPAFAIDSEQRQAFTIPQLEHDFCSAGQPLNLSYQWNVLAKQEGHHIITLIIIGLDAKGKELSELSVEIPVIVSNNPLTLPGVIASLGGIGGFIGLFFTITDHLSQRSKAS